MDPSNIDVKMKLAEIYEIMNQPRKALELVYQGLSTLPSCISTSDMISVIDAKQRRTRRLHEQGTSGIEEPISLFAEKAKERPRVSEPKKPTPDQLRALEAEQEKETLRGYARAQQLWIRVVAEPPEQDQREVEREWFFEVERLVESFRETRRLFQTSKVIFGGFIRHYDRIYPSCRIHSVVCFHKNELKSSLRMGRMRWHPVFISTWVSVV
jgi:general transcription factor 3C polypeptide 3 (transcription factor C subunit 4)